MIAQLPMKALVFDGVKLILKDIPTPQPSNSQVLIKIAYCGVCGTDYAILKNKLTTPVPLILGHEFSGTVTSVGTDVDPQWLHKRVTAEINTNTCHSCFYCGNNMPTQCKNRRALGIGVNGAWAEYLAIDVELVHELPSSISFEEATFIEPLAAAYQIFETMPLAPSDKTCIIFGGGRLGLLALQVAKTQGLTIIVIDHHSFKLKLAQQLGAQYIINAKSDDITQQVRQIWPQGADIVIDTTGSSQVIPNLLTVCRSRGKIHIKSTESIVPFDFREFVVRELTLYSSRCGPFTKAITALSSGKVQVKLFISHIYSFEEVLSVLNDQKRELDFIKVLIRA